MTSIKKLQALEILDSRGNPTVQVTVTLVNRGRQRSPPVRQRESGKQSSLGMATTNVTEEKAFSKRYQMC